MVAAQKYSWAAEELYSERVRAIRWFEKNHPDEFDLFGPRWDRYYVKGKLSIVNPVLARLYKMWPWLPHHRAFPSSRGSIPAKRPVMRQYKFSICYENSSYPGWLTEKMLDALFAGSVPIYLGDPEVTKMVPPAAFIDKNEFPDYDSLYAYLKGMPPAEYEAYRQAGHSFVHGDAIKPMGAEAYTQMFLREVVNDARA